MEPSLMISMELQGGSWSLHGVSRVSIGLDGVSMHACISMRLRGVSMDRHEGVHGVSTETYGDFMKVRGDSMDTHGYSDSMDTHGYSWGTP